MDGPGGNYAKSARERQIPDELSYMWTLFFKKFIDTEDWWLLEAGGEG